jgi:ABC-2 type transport system ATP-binding protein
MPSSSAPEPLQPQTLAVHKARASRPDSVRAPTFVHEPATCIDVASAREIRQLLAELNRGGTTTFLTTHYVEEAERLCHRIAFIVGEKAVRVGGLEELMRDHQRDSVLQISFEGPGRSPADAIRGRFPDLSVQPVDERNLRILVPAAIELLPLLAYAATLFLLSLRNIRRKWIS